MKKNNDKFSFIQDCPVRKLRNTGIRKKRSFFEAINSRGLEQLTYVFQELQAKAAKILNLKSQIVNQPILHADIRCFCKYGKSFVCHS